MPLLLFILLIIIINIYSFIHSSRSLRPVPDFLIALAQHSRKRSLQWGPGRDANPSLPYSRPMHCFLSFASPYTPHRAAPIWEKLSISKLVWVASKMQAEHGMGRSSSSIQVLCARLPRQSNVPQLVSLANRAFWLQSRGGMMAYYSITRSHIFSSQPKKDNLTSTVVEK